MSILNKSKKTSITKLKDVAEDSEWVNYTFDTREKIHSLINWMGEAYASVMLDATKLAKHIQEWDLWPSNSKCICTYNFETEKLEVEVGTLIVCSYRKLFHVVFTPTAKSEPWWNYVMENGICTELHHFFLSKQSN